MAVITITDSDFLHASSAELFGTFMSGEAFTAGMALYQDASGVLWKADCNAASDTTGAKARIVGLAASTAARAGQKIAVLKSGLVTCGSVLTAGVFYVLSGTAGKFCLPSDLVTDDWVCWGLRSISATQAYIDIQFDNYKKA